MKHTIIHFSSFDEHYCHDSGKNIDDLFESLWGIYESLDPLSARVLSLKIFVGSNFLEKTTLYFNTYSRVSVFWGNADDYWGYEAVFLVPKKMDVRIEESKDCIFFQTSSEKYLFIEGIKRSSPSFFEETKEMYSYVDDLLEKYGFSFFDVYRSWNFMDPVLKYYADFNRARNENFDRLNLVQYPAWTGIDARINEDSHIVSSVAASSHSFVTLLGKRQCEAVLYWPKFSRGVVLTVDGRNKLFISWTAAVSQKWETLFSDDISNNIRFTLDTVEELVHEANMKNSHLVSAIVYIKRPEYLTVFEDEYQARWYDFLYTLNVCDVCRDDWLFEIELIGVC